MNDTSPPPIRQPGSPVASLVLGIVGLIAWLIPIFGVPISITGLVFGIRALRTRAERERDEALLQARFRLS